MLEYIAARPAVWLLLVMALMLSLRCLKQIVSRLRVEGVRHLTTVGGRWLSPPESRG